MGPQVGECVASCAEGQGVAGEGNARAVALLGEGVARGESRGEEPSLTSWWRSRSRSFA